MKMAIRNASVAAAALLAAVPSLAAPSALIRCDGYGRRMGTGEALARLPLVIGSLGLFGVPETDQPGARQGGEKGVIACTEALEDERVKGNPVRKAEVLLMRGIRWYETGKFDQAFGDASAVLAADVPAASRQAFDRSIGVSARLLQAYARFGEGKQAEAEALAAQAAEARPWGNFTGGEALRIMAITPAISTAEAALLDRGFRLWPGAYRGTVREAAGDWAGAASDYRAVLATRDEGDPLLEARLAAVLALAGDAPGADATLASVQTKVDAMATRATGTDKAAQDAAQVVARSDELIQLAKAQLALMAGRNDDAKVLLGGKGRWLAPAPIVATVIANAQARLKTGGSAALGSLALDPLKLRADAESAARADMTGKLRTTYMAVLWPRWEDGDVLAGYGRDLAAPDKLKSESARDGKALQISLNRAAFVDTAGEAALAAAAQIAVEHGRDSFAIIERASTPGLTREGLTAANQRWQLVFAGDALWVSQASRIFTVAQVQANLTPSFPKPPAIPPQR